MKYLSYLLYPFIFSGILNATNYALDFDGTNDYVEVDNHASLSLDYPFTMQIWFKWDGTDGNTNFLVKGAVTGGTSGDGYAVRLDLTGSESLLTTQVGNNYNKHTGYEPSANSWHHVAVTDNGTNKVTYYDGINIYSVATNADDDIDNQLFIGQNFHGVIDEVTIWNAALTQSEIQANMHTELTGSESNLVAYWNFNEGTGSTTDDNSTNANNGTLGTSSVGDTGEPVWVLSTAPMANLTYTTDIEAIWTVTGTSTSNPSDGLSLQVSSQLADGNFAVFGNNNLSSTSIDDLTAVTSTIRTSRIWQVEETGTVSASVTIDISVATGNADQSGTASNYKLLYRAGTSGNFSSVTTGNSIVGDAVTFTNVALSDGYYALGAEGDASLPVELSSFTANTTREGEIELVWITESEIENIGFILERRETNEESWREIASYLTESTLQGQGSVTYRTEYRYTDNTVEESKQYDYRLADVSYAGEKTYHSVTVLAVQTNTVPQSFRLYPAYPNPFNPVATISYELITAGDVTLTVYDMAGREVVTLVNQHRSVGHHTARWNAENLSSGTYLIKLTQNENTSMQKIILLK